jgi:polyphosphate kinase
MFPLIAPALRQRVYDEILVMYLKDNVKTRLLASDGNYVRISDNSRIHRNGFRFNAQEFFMRTDEREPQIDPNVISSQASLATSAA